MYNTQFFEIPPQGPDLNLALHSRVEPLNPLAKLHLCHDLIHYT